MAIRRYGAGAEGDSKRQGCTVVSNQSWNWDKKDGAESRTRTDDLLITNQLLYQLSYFGL